MPGLLLAVPFGAGGFVDRIVATAPRVTVTAAATTQGAQTERQSSLVNELAWGPISSIPPSTGQDAPVT
ncbi:hypothetical protein FBZ33_2539 [Micromonospora sp. A202]|nr:hypothetical protein FBZ33_2539 [Micromonospora sp. A202]